MPTYSALFYTLSDISVTSNEWLGLGVIKDFQTTPVTNFEFEITAGDDDDPSRTPSYSRVSINDLPII